MSSDTRLSGIRALVAEFRGQIERLRRENRELREDVARLVQESMRPIEDPLVSSLEEEIRRLRAQNKGLRAQLQGQLPVADPSSSLQLLPTLGEMDSEVFSAEEVSVPETSRSRWKIHLVDEEHESGTP